MKYIKSYKNWLNEIIGTIATTIGRRVIAKKAAKYQYKKEKEKENQQQEIITND